MAATDLETFWDQRFGAIAPLGFCLRAQLPDRWLRVHALPRSKRYADSDDERGEVLRRMNAVGDAVLEPDSECWLITAAWELDGHGRLHELPSVALHERTLAREVDVESGPVICHGGLVRWRAGAFDPLFTAIADDVRRALWVCVQTGAVLAPYDGGADLITPTEGERDALRAKFGAWLSSRSDGL